MNSFHSWRAAIRIARRDTWRSKGRSLLVLLMIALPIVGVTAIDVTLRSAELDPGQRLERSLGAADARYSDAETGGTPIMQEPAGGGAYATDKKYADDPRLQEAKPVNIPAALPAGAEWITDTVGTGLIRTKHGMLDTGLRELPSEHPIAAGLLTLRRGHLPAKDREIAASEAFLERSGLYLGSSTSVRGVKGTFTIVGVVETPGDIRTPRLTARPGALLAELERTMAVHGAGRYATSTSYLVAVPGSVTWDLVRQANEKGLMVESREVVLDPPPHGQVPYFQSEDSWAPDDGGLGQATAVAATVAAMAVLEICLLAGPAFAVGARRSRRQLGLVGANGGNSGHVRAVVLAGGLVIGAAAAVLGVALGIGLTAALQPLLEQAVGKRFASLDIRPLELTAIAMAGLVTGLLAAVVPAFVASRQSVLESLTGRRGVRRSSRVLPVVGLGAVILGMSVAVFGAVAMVSPVPVAAGSAIAELGVVAMTPALVGLFGRLGRWLPLSPRLALRDAVRNRGRTAPAVAAVLAAVAGTIAVATYTVSTGEQHRREYEALLPAGRAVVSVEPAELAALPRLRAAVRKDLPVDERADFGRAVAGSKDCGAVGTGDPDCGQITILTPEGQECPLDAENGAPSASERRKYRDDWRCVEDYSSGATALYTDSRFLVGGPGVLKALGVDDPKAVRALEEGGAVAFDRGVVKDGTVTLSVSAVYDERAEKRDGREVRVPVYASGAESYGIQALVSEQAMKDAGVRTVAFGSLYTTTTPPTSADVQKLTGDTARMGVTAGAYIERGFQSDDGIILLSLALFAGLVTIGAAGIATGLAQADAEADLNTLAAVGAAPRVRRTLSGLQCGAVALMGVVLGAVAGVVPAIGLLKAEEAVALKAMAAGEAGGFAASAVNMPIVLPWTTLLEILVVVPLGAALLATLFTRSRTTLARRAG